MLAKAADFNGIGKTFGVDPVIARIVRNREVVGEEALRAYFSPELSDLHDPSSLKGAREAAALLQKKISEQKKIRIIGDYDIDGVCAAYILKVCLEVCGGLADVVIPNRIADGYGLNGRLVEEAARDGIDTLLTCDNGIAAAPQIAAAKAFGMTVIVTDHHEVPYEAGEDGSRIQTLPPADAVVDPKQEDCPYPYKGICGAVVAYKVMSLYLDRMCRAGAVTEEAKGALMQELLAFAGFATVGDVMELTDENLSTEF